MQRLVMRRVPPEPDVAGGCLDDVLRDVTHLVLAGGCLVLCAEEDEVDAALHRLVDNRMTGVACLQQKSASAAAFSARVSNSSPLDASSGSSASRGSERFTSMTWTA
jgi:hypothetical protein